MSYKSHVFKRCHDYDTYRLHGLKNTKIYVTNQAYWDMSESFIEECKLRNIRIEIIFCKQ